MRWDTSRFLPAADMTRLGNAKRPVVDIALAAVVGLLMGAVSVPMLRWVGLPASWWGVPVALALLMVFAQESTQRLMGRGSLANGPVLRFAHALLMFGAYLNFIGLGFLLPTVAVLPAVVHIQWSGSRAWQPIVRVTVLATIVNQALIQIGLVPTVVPVAATHMLALPIVGIACVTIANIGLTMAAREQAAERLADAERRFRTLVHNSSDVVTVVDADQVFTYVSPAAEAVLGLSTAELEGRAASTLVRLDDRPGFVRYLAEVTTGPTAESQRWEARMDTGADPDPEGAGRRWLEFNAKNLLDDPVVAGVVLHVRDVSERREFQDRLAYAASHDPLTGLHNRAALLQRAEPLLRSARPGAAVAVLFCDLDRFKQVNDALGHGAGDQVLLAVAQRMRHAVRPGDLVARMGGDEFAVLLPGVADRRVAEEIADRIRSSVGEPVVLSDGHLATVGVSVGVVVVETGTDDADDVLRRADLLMYGEKEGPRAERRGRPAVAPRSPATRG